MISPLFWKFSNPPPSGVRSYLNSLLPYRPLPYLSANRVGTRQRRQTSLHWRKVHLEWALVQVRRSRRRRGVSTTRWSGRWFLSPAARSRDAPEPRDRCSGRLNRSLGDIFEWFKNRLGKTEWLVFFISLDYYTPWTTFADYHLNIIYIFSVSKMI